MDVLDLISDSSRIYIFQKRTNKTNLGGIFTLVYLIILILITVAYLYDYFESAPYQYNNFYKYINEEDRAKLKKENKDYTPDITFRFVILDKNFSRVNDKFVFYGFRSGFIDINESYIKGNVDEFSFYILYKIQKKNDSNITEEEFTLNIFYDSKIFDHKNTNVPVRNSTYNLVQSFSTCVLVSIDAFWSIYNYEEEKGIFSKIYDYMVNV